MYLEHFNFSQFPFALTPNTGFYCDLEGHRAGLNVLFVSLRSGEGFIKIIGEVGTGKTLLCRKLLNSLNDEFVTAYIPNPELTPAGLRRAFANELGLKPQPHIDSQGLLELINQTLLNLFSQEKKVVLLIDEAQALPTESLESLRLLTNLETESTKLLQVVLFAQPELDERLNQKNLRQLKQRITFSYQLPLLSRQDMDAYICHRLSMVGCTHGALFTRRARDLLYKGSRGVPRLINILCHKALMVAYGQGKQYIDKNAVALAISDTIETTPVRTFFKKLSYFIAVLMGLVVVRLIVMRTGV